MTNASEFKQEYIDQNSFSSTVLFAHCLAVIVFSLQAFYPANKDMNVKYGDTIAARCLFTGEGRTSKTYIG